MMLPHKMSASLSAGVSTSHPTSAVSNLAWSDVLAAQGSTEFAAAFAFILLGFIAQYGLRSIVRFRQRRHLAAASKEHHRFYEALIQQSDQAVLVLASDTIAPTSFCGGAQLLEDCLSGPNPIKVARALNTLLQFGIPFTATALTNDGRSIVIRGQPIGRRVVLFFPAENSLIQTSQLQTILDALPIAVWIRKRNLCLHWANQAFIQTIGDLDRQTGKGPPIKNWDRDVVVAALNAHQSVRNQQLVTVSGRKQVLDVTMRRFGDEQVLGFAINQTERFALESQLTEALETFSQTIALLPVSLAIFDRSQRLVHYNNSYALLWGLPSSWLDTQPSLGMIFDRLREENKLPQQRDFSSWKHDQLAAVFGPHPPLGAIWHLPKDKTILSNTHTHPRGRLQITEDISGRMILETSMNLLLEVQKAVIETLEDAAAIFGPNGKLLLFNALFARLWELRDENLFEQPHVASITSICATRYGRDGIWEAVSDAIYAIKTDSRRKWGRVVRGDGKPLSLSLARLPNSATLVLFSDLTDLENFEALQREEKLLMQPKAS